MIISGEPPKMHTRVIHQETIAGVDKLEKKIRRWLLLAINDATEAVA